MAIVAVLTALVIVHASVPANTFAIYGRGEDKELTELVPGILNQLGPDSLASLRKLAESYQSLQKKEGEDGGEKGDSDDDDIPDLVQGINFENRPAEESKSEEKGEEKAEEKAEEKVEEKAEEEKKVEE